MRAMESPAAWKVSAYIGSNLIRVIDWAFSHICRFLVAHSATQYISISVSHTFRSTNNWSCFIFRWQLKVDGNRLDSNSWYFR